MTFAEASRLLDLCLPLGSPAELKEGYREALMVWHPDRFTDEKLRAKAEIKTRQVLEAYELLKRLRPTDERLYGSPSTSATQPEEVVQQKPAPAPVPVRRSRPSIRRQSPSSPVKAVFRSAVLAAVAMALIIGIDVWKQAARSQQTVRLARPVPDFVMPVKQQPAGWPTDKDLAALQADLAAAHPDDPELARTVVAQYRRMMEVTTILPTAEPLKK